MYAYKSEMWKDKYGEDFEGATRAEALRMKDELNKAFKQ